MQVVGADRGPFLVACGRFRTTRLLYLPVVRLRASSRDALLIR
jgi:hypothetical protein